MRLFVAVELDENVRAAAEGVARDLERRLDPRVSARWVSVDKMHLTVRFIGHIVDDRVPTVLQALRPPLSIAPFEVALGSCGTFPRTGAPRVFWIGLAEGLSSLQAMHEEFNRRLLPLGFASEDRPFSAHLTLARVKEMPRESGRPTRETIAATRVPAVACRVDAATVFQSLLSPKGSKYAPLLHVPCERNH
ncbi:MAG TPA: RNA 2',3'-cyclic phosphodiesterase [Vicinamibacterales bacterium]|nr:RNA 2',3'-cyclic phosphodiesterase [Vicinamibacterales bacterium]